MSSKYKVMQQNLDTWFEKGRLVQSSTGNLVT